MALQGTERGVVRRGLRAVLQQLLQPAQLQQHQRLELRRLGQLGQDDVDQQERQDLHRRARLFLGCQ